MRLFILSDKLKFTFLSPRFTRLSVMMTSHFESACPRKIIFTCLLIYRDSKLVTYIYYSLLGNFSRFEKNFPNSKTSLIRTNLSVPWKFGLEKFHYIYIYIYTNIKICFYFSYYIWRTLLIIYIYML